MEIHWYTWIKGSEGVEEQDITYDVDAFTEREYTG